MELKFKVGDLIKMKANMIEDKEVDIIEITGFEPEHQLMRGGKISAYCIKVIAGADKRPNWGEVKFVEYFGRKIGTANWFTRRLYGD